MTLDSQRQSLADLQRATLDFVRGASGIAGDDWARENLVDVPSPQLLAFLQKAQRWTRMKRLKMFFPRFAAHAALPQAFLAELSAPTVTSEPAEALDLYFDACAALVAARTDAAIWLDLLRLERADFLRRLLPAQPMPALVADLCALAAEGVKLDTRGLCERPGISLFSQSTTLPDFWQVRDLPPTEAQVWGDERLFAAYWCERRRNVRFLAVQSLRDLALELALTG